ncbi:hypothetical protein CHGG_05353 [Chaetomium globosum CBS 148.51]|uniref:3'-5' exonuclease domain-containing protein n=1 Tax=Chaetomium globosum (strain ATCC 6205 / CBS 148.51 / DSM 1962 / NBRC 6347 / NRRL 1970) TaxID=306901 RepID=Q2H7L2_CHAGB|nr:uncharacterized protein CHGG_05353 [Chaetomium globosum CBS 148.51]EAQ88734.1 hypothetical protein CHGG_05353 [Chaetomium globosum CBS 148.51]
MSSSTSHSIAAKAESARDMIDMVDTTAKLSEMLDTLEGLPTEPPSLYFDLEGENLSRHGSVSILQLHVLPSSRRYLVDVHTLQHTAFSTCGENGLTLKELLESDGILKVFSIGLSRCIERGACLLAAELATWKAVKDAGVKLFSPDYGGSYTVFVERPLCDAIKLYSAQDAQILPRLWSQYNTRMTPVWTRKAHETSKERVALSQTATFNGKGRHMALAPPGWH